MVSKNTKAKKRAAASGAPSTPTTAATTNGGAGTESPSIASPITPSTSTSNGNSTRRSGTDRTASTSSSSSSIPPLVPDTVGGAKAKPEASKPAPAPAPAPASPTPEPTRQKSAEEIKELGNVAFKKGRYQEAVERYTEAIDLKPTEPSYLTNRAAAYMSLKKFKLALTDCQTAATLQSSQPVPKTLFRLARCQLALGQPGPALSSFSTVLSLDPGNAAAKASKKTAEDLQSHLSNFERARKSKDWGMARLALEKCMQGVEGIGSELPNEWRVWRIELEVARGNWDAATTAANDALRIEPNSPEVLYQRGLVLFLTGKLTQALAHAGSALRLDPAHVPSSALRKRTKEVEKLKDEGNTAFKAGKLQEALEKYTDALEKVGEKDEEGKGGPIRATLLSNRATTLLKLSRYDEALLETNSSLFLVPSSFKALRTRARIHLELEKYEEAVQDFKAAQQNAETEPDRKAVIQELKKAEVALKRSKTKDYYKILGVAKDCSESDIKKGYRRESLKHHPDKGGDEEKFKLVVEAHAVLSDPQRRQRYDMGEDEDGLNDGGGGGFGPGGPGFSHVDLAELFSQFGMGGAGGHGGFSGGGFGGGGGGGYGRRGGF